MVLEHTIESYVINNVPILAIKLTLFWNQPIPHLEAPSNVPTKGKEDRDGPSS
jgi:hypothetical protein